MIIPPVNSAARSDDNRDPASTNAASRAMPFARDTISSAAAVDPYALDVANIAGVFGPSVRQTQDTDSGCRQTDSGCFQTQSGCTQTDSGCRGTQNGCYRPG